MGGIRRAELIAQMTGLDSYPLILHLAEGVRLCPDQVKKVLAFAMHRTIGHNSYKLTSFIIWQDLFSGQSGHRGRKLSVKLDEIYPPSRCQKILRSSCGSLMIHDTQLPILLQYYCIASMLEPRLSFKSDHASFDHGLCGNAH